MGITWRPSRFAKRLAVIVAIALLWRLLYVQLEIKVTLLTDEEWYIAMARQMFTSQRFDNIFNGLPTAQHGPLTSLLLAPFAWLFPHSIDGLRNVMPFVGAGSVTFLGLSAKEVGGERAGLIAAGLAAILPDLWIRDGLVVSEPLSILLVAICVFVALRSKRSFGWTEAFVMGLTCGLVALTRAELAPLLFGITLVTIVRRAPKKALSRGALALVAVLMTLAPWFVFNQSRFARTVTLTNNLGITLAGANCNRTYYNWAIIGYDSQVCWNRAQDQANKISSDESVQSAYMRHLGISYAVNHASRWPVVAVMRVAWFMGLYRPGWVVTMGTYGGQPAWATWLQVITFYILFPASMALWWINRRRAWPHALLASLVLYSFLVVVLFVGHWRYRVSLDVAMVLIVGLGINQWWESRERPDGLGTRQIAPDSQVTS